MFIRNSGTLIDNTQFVGAFRILDFKQDSRSPFMGHPVSCAHHASLQLQVIQRPSRGRYRAAHSPWQAAPLRWTWPFRLRLTLTCIPPLQLHGDASCYKRARESVYNESKRARPISRVDGSRFRLALSNDPPLSCHFTPLGLSLITSLSSRYLLLSSRPPTQLSFPRPPAPSTTTLIRAASGVTLNSGSTVMYNDKSWRRQGMDLCKKSKARHFARKILIALLQAVISYLFASDNMHFSNYQKYTYFWFEENCIVPKSQIQLFFYSFHDRKNDFEACKQLTKYKSENNFVRSSKYLCKNSNLLLEYQNLLQHCLRFLCNYLIIQ